MVITSLYILVIGISRYMGLPARLVRYLCSDTAGDLVEVGSDLGF